LSGSNTGDQDLSSFATSANLALKANIASPTFTGTVGGIDKTMVGLENVDNTTDLLKPVSTATQTELNLKANIASPTFTGTVAAEILTSGTVTYPSVHNSINGQVLTTNASGVASWVTVSTVVREEANEFTATLSQITFILTQTPSANSKVKMYINGIRISNLANTLSGTTVTYVAAYNGAYALTAGDRIQFDYFY
jgi:hypothetical protein